MATSYSELDVYARGAIDGIKAWRRTVDAVESKTIPADTDATYLLDELLELRQRRIDRDELDANSLHLVRRAG